MQLLCMTETQCVWSIIHMNWCASSKEKYCFLIFQPINWCCSRNPADGYFQTISMTRFKKKKEKKVFLSFCNLRILIPAIHFSCQYIGVAIIAMFVVRVEWHCCRYCSSLIQGMLNEMERRKNWRNLNATQPPVDLQFIQCGWLFFHCLPCATSRCVFPLGAADWRVLHSDPVFHHSLWAKKKKNEEAGY